MFRERPRGAGKDERRGPEHRRVEESGPGVTERREERSRAPPGGIERPGGHGKTGGEVQSTAGWKRAAGGPGKDKRSGQEHRRVERRARVATFSLPFALYPSL
jgi:hypothetical protein